VWTEIRQKAETSRAPPVVYREQSLVAKLLRDLLTEDFQAIRIDHELEHRRVLELIERIMPPLAPKVKLYEKEYRSSRSTASRRRSTSALRSKVWLKSGGSIVINQTEALVAIDVNTGPLRRQEDAGRLEDTISRRTSRRRRRSSGSPPARSRRHHRARLHRHGGEEEPPEGLPGGGAGAAQGRGAVEGASGADFGSSSSRASA
jgi:hypothetical protein